MTTSTSTNTQMYGVDPSLTVADPAYAYGSAPLPLLRTTTTTTTEPAMQPDMGSYGGGGNQNYPHSSFPLGSIQDRAESERYESEKFIGATGGQIAMRIWTTFSMEFLASLLYYIVILMATNTGVSFLGLCFADAAAITALMSIFARENACHIDPCITLGLAATGKLGLKWYWMFVYLLAQPIACIVACLFVWAMTPGFDRFLGLGVEVLAFGYTPGQGLCAVFFGAFITYTVHIWMVNARGVRNFYEHTEFSYKHNTLFALSLGFSRLMADIGLGKVAGVYFNWYPQFFSGVISSQTDTSNWWIWFVGPGLGVICAVGVYYLNHWWDEMAYPVTSDPETKPHSA